MSGPYDDESEALAEPMPQAVRALHEAGRVRSGDPDRLVHTAQARALLQACTDAGVPLGLYDAAIVDWLARWESGTVQVVIGWIERAHEAGRAGR
jgi:hypothetical protein